MKNESEIKLEIKNYLDAFDYDKSNKYYDGIEEILKDDDVINKIYNDYCSNIEDDSDMILFDMCELIVFERFSNAFTDNLINDGWILNGSNFEQNGVEESGSDLFWELLDYKSDISENLGMNYEMWLEQ
tara:strand:- start:632 stop:1018 length:387 start_codon:yes stop_codon:yes gene_type:complete